MNAQREAQKVAVEHWKAWSIGYRQHGSGEVDPDLERDVGAGYPFRVRLPSPNDYRAAGEWFRSIFLALHECYGPEGLDRQSARKICAAAECGRWIATVVQLRELSEERMMYTYDIWFVDPHDAFDFKLRYG